VVCLVVCLVGESWMAGVLASGAEAVPFLDGVRELFGAGSA